MEADKEVWKLWAWVRRGGSEVSARDESRHSSLAGRHMQKSLARSSEQSERMFECVHGSGASVFCACRYAEERLTGTQTKAIHIGFYSGRDVFPHSKRQFFLLTKDVMITDSMALITVRLTTVISPGGRLMVGILKHSPEETDSTLFDCTTLTRTLS